MAATLPKTLGPEALKIAKASARELRKIKKVDPRTRYVLLLPHSESAHVGMGFKTLNIPPAERVYEMASDLVKRDLLKLCLDGPKSDLLNSIENRNLATFVTSHATLAKLEHEKPEISVLCKAAGGIGIGFVNALVFGGAMTFEDGLDLVQRQGQAMDRAAKVIPSARVRLRLMPATSKTKVCQAAIEHCIKLGIPSEVAVCNVTQQLSPHILEFAGHEEAIRYLEEDGLRLFKFRWINRESRTPQAFNTELMRPVSDFLQVYIKQRLEKNSDYIKEPLVCSAYSSNAGYRMRHVKEITKDLITSPVRTLKVEQLFHTLYARPLHVPQPNTIVLWDPRILKTLEKVNRLARLNAKLYI